MESNKDDASEVAKSARDGIVQLQARVASESRYQLAAIAAYFLFVTQFYNDGWAHKLAVGAAAISIVLAAFAYFFAFISELQARLNTMSSDISSGRRDVDSWSNCFRGLMITLSVSVAAFAWGTLFFS